MYNDPLKGYNDYALYPLMIDRLNPTVTQSSRDQIYFYKHLKLIINAFINVFIYV